MALDYVIDLLHTVGAAADKLRQMTESQSPRRPTPEKWSPKEIIGHLIDSASNNHKRFVCAQIQDNLCFDGYEQNEWVRRQAYQYEDWSQLITLWQTFNCHLAHSWNPLRTPSVSSLTQIITLTCARGKSQRSITSCAITSDI